MNSNEEQSLNILNTYKKESRSFHEGLNIGCSCWPWIHQLGIRDKDTPVASSDLMFCDILDGNVFPAFFWGRLTYTGPLVFVQHVANSAAAVKPTQVIVAVMVTEGLAVNGWFTLIDVCKGAGRKGKKQQVKSALLFK